MVTDLPPLMQVERDDKKKITGETNLEQSRLRKKEMRKAEDVLDEIGQPNESRGIRATQKAYKEYQEESFRIKSDRIEWLNNKAKFCKDKLSYYRGVDTIVRYEMSFLELPLGYKVISEVSPLGIKLVLTDRFGGIHVGGFKPCGLGIYDEQACRTSINKLDDKISFLEENPPSGLYLP